MRTKPLFHFGRNRSLVVQELEPRRVLTGMTCLPPDHTSCSAVVVDDFNDPGTITPLVVNSGTPLDIASDSGLSGVIGGTRTAQLEYLSGVLSLHVGIYEVAGEWLYSVSTSPLTDGKTELYYGTTDAGTLNPLNLDLGPDASNGSFSFDVWGTGPLDVDIDVGVTLFDGAGNQEFEAIVINIEEPGGDFFIPLSDFTEVDLRDIDGITVVMDPPEDGDINLRDMSILLPPVVESGVVRLEDRGTETVLLVYGTDAADEVHVNKAGENLKVEASFLTTPDQEVTFPYADVDKIIMHLGDGNDEAVVSNNVSIPALIDGGGDDDFLNGGGGPSILLGDAGNDNLRGGNLNDILIGGLGSDRSVGNQGEDILIGGHTAHDTNEAVLWQLLDEWNSSDDYDTRVANIRTGAGSLGGIKLQMGGVDATVFDDGDFDKLTGSSGRDWFFFDDDEDKVTGKKSNEEEN